MEIFIIIYFKIIYEGFILILQFSLVSNFFYDKLKFSLFNLTLKLNQIRCINIVFPINLQQDVSYILN